MRDVMLEADPHLLEERRRWGADRWDELWNGELHMVPPPGERHQHFGSELLVAIAPLAGARGLRVAYEVGLFRAIDDYRVPDLTVYRPDQASARGVQAAELVIETVSPGDASRRKLPWYADRGVAEVLLVERDTLAVELLANDGGKLLPVVPARSAVLGATFERVGDDHLRVVPDGSDAAPLDVRL
jgi:Uma2 family endonuclease